MIRVSNNPAKAMEFTSFKKKETVTDDELMAAVQKFETVLNKQNGIIFHCLVRNFKNEYANLLFVEEINHLHLLSEQMGSIPEAKDFFDLIEMQTVKMIFHEILKDNFQVPQGFSCVEHGTFSLKPDSTFEALKKASNELETNYLNTFDNSLEHFVGKVKNKVVSEIAFGKTYAKTKEICYGYYNTPFGKALLNLADTETFDLDFYYVVA
ncbi:hypothetical protein [Arthrospiribacter ruber]|uniref:Uncharacterized protein n=1 Tax=Arthrospiribacter ruber TaxID=2487934 RepID=A0A951MAI5_9BACT|nr:hypothetical protein [Arthrospiribacter ruber]MBW3466629.1 hypothetical protein [Arthrospiribacter ruber]